MSSYGNHLDKIIAENYASANSRSNPVTIKCSPRMPSHSHGSCSGGGDGGHTGPMGYRGHTGCRGPTGLKGPTGKIGYRGHTGDTGPTGQTGHRGVGTFNLKTIYPDIDFPRDNKIQKIENDSNVSYVNSEEIFQHSILSFKAPVNGNRFKAGLNDAKNSDEFFHYLHFHDSTYDIVITILDDNGSTGITTISDLPYQEDDNFVLLIDNAVITVTQNETVMYHNTNRYSGRFHQALFGLYSMGSSISDIAFGYLSGGNTGMTGATGATGATGLRGETGYTGYTGQAGEAGSQGPAGSDGISGGLIIHLDADTGTAATIGSIKKSPITTTQTVVECPVNTSSTVPKISFYSDSGLLTNRVIPEGVWRINLYASLNDLSGGSVSFYTNIYKTESGQEVLLVDG